MKKQFFLFAGIALLLDVDAQSNWLGGANPPIGPNFINGGNNILGTQGNFPIRLNTNNTLRATVTTNNGLVNTNLLNFNFITAPQVGDGISVAAGFGSNPAASIDIFTSNANQTFIRMDGPSWRGYEALPAGKLIRAFFVL